MNVWMMSKKAWSPGRMIRSREDVRVRAAALARDRVDVVDVLRAEVEQELRDVGDELALADARLELLRRSAGTRRRPSRRPC